MHVGNWIIERVADYDSKQALLSNQIEFHGVEFSGTPRIGQNAVTGTGYVNSSGIILLVPRGDAWPL